MKGQQKRTKTTDVERAEESQARQQPAAGEKESNAPHIPAALESGSLETISSVMLEKLGTPLHEDLQIEAEAEPKAIKPLMYTDLDEKDADNNQPLGCEVMNVTDTEPEAPTLTMQTYSDEVDTPNDHPLESRVELWWHSILGKASLALLTLSSMLADFLLLSSFSFNNSGE
ncbi:hypothetical protein SRHO_G00019460 [Serrasalmus rhombeus]